MKNDEPFWKRIYKKHPRNRAESLTAENERALENLWFGANQNEDDFHDLLETISEVAVGLAKGDIGAAVANPLRPALRDKWKAPELPTIEGVPMPNPYVKGGSVADRKMLERKVAIAKSAFDDNPRDILAAAEFHQWNSIVTHLKRSAAEPVKYAFEKAAEEESRVRWNFAIENYDPSKNSYFTKEGVLEFEQTVEPELKPLYRALARPMSLPLFGANSEQHRTLIYSLYRIGGKTWQAIEAGQAREMKLRADERERAAAEKAERIKTALQTQRDIQELEAGITVLPDGRRITLGGSRRIRLA
jgi:hypothetical protein